jgi:hypothetical protein
MALGNTNNLKLKFVILLYHILMKRRVNFCDLHDGGIWCEVFDWKNSHCSMNHKSLRKMLVKVKGLVGKKAKNKMDISRLKLIYQLLIHVIN